jgi:hypothetical protein
MQRHSSHLDTEQRSVHAPHMPAFPVFELGANVGREGDEQLGSKRKFWFRHADDELWLFKYARPGTGEHWAEKTAAEIAGVLGLPHAVVELARFEGAWGTITSDFTNQGQQSLVHGNELLTELDPEYPTTKTYRVRAHTLTAVHTALNQDFIRAPSSSLAPLEFGPFDVFVGYLLLDALIGNTDRHHENWGVLLTSAQPRVAELAPTYDHASSLGRELTDEVRHRKYRERGARKGPRQYFAGSRSALFSTAGDRSPMSPLAAFRAALAMAPSAGQFWLDRVRANEDQVLTVAAAVPEEAISRGARDFCTELLSLGLRSLLE